MRKDHTNLELKRVHKTIEEHEANLKQKADEIFTHSIDIDTI